MNIVLLNEAVKKTKALLPHTAPTTAVILGSGWGCVVSTFSEIHSIPYAKVPCLGSTQVKGHEGRLIVAEHNGSQIMFFQGRRHWYEGAGWEPVALPILLCAELGVSTLILTNAAGGIRSDLNTGSLMVIDDHINAMGVNPLQGPHDPLLGPRFPDQTRVYNEKVRQSIDRSAQTLNIPLAHGVYAAVCGPTYETPAEVNALRLMGADAVGMSTVPEAILANAIGLNVAAISCITNHAAGIRHEPLSHEDVITNTHNAQPAMTALFKQLLPSIA